MSILCNRVVLSTTFMSSRRRPTHHANKYNCYNNKYDCTRTIFQLHHQQQVMTHRISLNNAKLSIQPRSTNYQQSKSYGTRLSTAVLVTGTTATTLLLYYKYYRWCCTATDTDINSVQQHHPQQQLEKCMYQQYHHRMNITQCDTNGDTTTTTDHPNFMIHYSEDPDYYDSNDSSGYIEEERFYQCVTYHRSLLHDYNRRWGNNTNSLTTHHHHHQQQRRWPRNVPQHVDEVSGLECDLIYCQRNLKYQQNYQDKTGDTNNSSYLAALRLCQDTKFRIATYYIFTLQPTQDYNVNDNDHNMINYKQIQHEKGFRVIKELAEQSYPDAMCLYGILLNEGNMGVEANPQQAVVWWRRCVDEYGHINSLYELANACYLGEGIVENPPMAVSLFRRAAHLGHPGAAYMLGECKLNGVGVERDRVDALEWLVTAAELGHRGAQDRVLMILNEDYGTMSTNTSPDIAKQRQLEETVKWINDEDVKSYDPIIETLHKAVNIERRFTIGGGSRNPVVVARRKSIVAESREES